MARLRNLVPACIPRNDAAQIVVLSRRRGESRNLIVFPSATVFRRPRCFVEDWNMVQHLSC